MDRPFLHVVDLKATKAYQRRVPITVAMVELSKARTFLGVPLYHNRSPIGIIGLYREEVHPFTDTQMNWFRILERRPSLRSRMRGCSMNCVNRFSSRPPPPMSSK